VTFADDGDPPHADLTSRQAAIVRFCEDYRERKGYPPTFLEIGAAVGHIWLLPENPAYEPFIGDEAEILGKVVHVDRTLR
jgi:SOS-response transcriptional repressor LexA